MTIGIYALYWEEQDLIYIGQSQNIERRFREHLYDLRCVNHSNYKVQNCYNKYGNPSIHIIEVCTLEHLNDREVYWTKDFDSISSGLNIIEAGQVGHGTNSNASKYSRLEVLKVFRSLYSTTHTYEAIARKHNVNIGLVGDIRKGNTHVWIQDEYPNLYLRMKAIREVLGRNCSKISSNRNIVLVSPCGEEHYVDSISEFSQKFFPKTTAIKHIVKGVSRLINKDSKSYKGWRLKDALN